jgi:hypothetical protein
MDLHAGDFAKLPDAALDATVDALAEDEAGELEYNWSFWGPRQTASMLPSGWSMRCRTRVLLPNKRARDYCAGNGLRLIQVNALPRSHPWCFPSWSWGYTASRM